MWRVRPSLAGLTSIAISTDGPASFAPSRPDRPTPPSPITATFCPGRTPAVFSAAPTPVITAQPNTAAISSGTSLSTRTTEPRSTPAYSATHANQDGLFTGTTRAARTHSCKGVGGGKSVYEGVA